MHAAPGPAQTHTAFRIDHADCLSFLESLAPGSVDVVTTDPAYSGMNEHMAFGSGRIVGDYQSDENARWFREFHDDPEAFRALLTACHRVMADNSHIYVMFDSYSLLSLGPVMREFFDVKGIVVWDKVNLGMGHYFRRRHELVVFATKGRRKLSRRDLPDVWQVKRIHRAAYPTQKPVALFAKMLEGSAAPGMTVCDPFTGSGSSAIAAMQAGCNFVGCDVSDEAVRVATERCAAYAKTASDPLEKRRAN